MTRPPSFVQKCKFRKEKKNKKEKRKKRQTDTYHVYLYNYLQYVIDEFVMQ